MQVVPSQAVVRPLVLIAAALVTVGLAAGGMAGPASADWTALLCCLPESGRITGPRLGTPIESPSLSSAQRSTTSWGALMEQTGIVGSAELRPTNAPPVGELGPAYTVTWIYPGSPGEALAGRTIRQEIYPNAGGGPLVRNVEIPNGWGFVVDGWFVAPDGVRVTLAQLGVPLSGAAAAQGATATGRATPDEDGSAATFPLWILGGGVALAAVGLGAAAAGRRAIRTP